MPPTSGDNTGRVPAVVDRKLLSDNPSPKMLNPKGSTVPPDNQPGLPTGPVCYYCKRCGHVKAECRALQRKHAKPMTVASPANVGTAIPKEYAPFISSGVVALLGSGKSIPITILRDTGAVQSLILESTLPFSDDSAVGQEVTLQGVELGHVSVPLHSVHLKCNLVDGPVIVGVRPSLPVRGVSLILGNDLAGQRVTATDTMTVSSMSVGVVTRAMARRQVTEADVDNSHGEFSTVEENVVDDEHSCNVEKQPVNQASTEDVSLLTFTRQELLREQSDDPEIQQLCQYALDEHKVDTVPRGYFMKDGVLMRKWRPPTVPASHEWSMIYQIVVPQKYRSTVLSLAHDTPMAGHLGVSKTHRRVLNHFYWPGISRDVKKFCKSCHTCQVVGKANQKPKVAPLKPIPVAKEPFSHVIIDCVGPLPKTKKGNQYLLTIMCGSTRFPEAIPLRNIKTPQIVRALVKFFTLFGLPRAVQSDQGSNFMSGLFQEVMFQLGISQLTSSAYHPQSQGALERFHQTLKSMIRAYCFQEGKDWDEGIPLLLFLQLFKHTLSS